MGRKIEHIEGTVRLKPGRDKSVLNRHPWIFSGAIEPDFKNRLPRDVLGIGDDCAAVPSLPAALLTTDLMVENIHFLRKEIGAKNLGYKSLAVNLSDIAACGGRPLYALLSIAIPPDVEVEWLDLFFTGLRELAEEFNVSLVGGDTTRSPGPLTINITVLGEAPGGGPKLRSGAKSGDLICVTGFLGDSAAGLKVILDEAQRDEDAQYLILQHHRPRPNVFEGQWLGARSEVHAMMDLSDGLASDLPHILKASRSGAEVRINELPVSTQFRSVCKRNSWDGEKIAFVGGEEYELLLTIDPDSAEQLQRQYKQRFGRELYIIGVTTGCAGELHLFRDGELIKAPEAFHHF